MTVCFGEYVVYVLRDLFGISEVILTALIALIALISGELTRVVVLAEGDIS